MKNKENNLCTVKSCEVHGVKSNCPHKLKHTQRFINSDNKDEKIMTFLIKVYCADCGKTLKATLLEEIKEL